MPLCLLAQPASHNSERIAKLEAESRSLEDIDVRKGAQLAVHALQLAVDDPAARERLNGWIGHLKRFEARYDSATIYLQAAIDLAKLHSSPSLPNHLNELGMVHRQQGNITEAMKLHLEALALAQDNKDRDQTAAALYNVGFIYYTETSYDTAMSYFKQSKSVRESMNDPVGLATSYNGIGLVLMRKEIYDSSRNWFLKGTTLIDEKKSPRVMAILYNNLGITYEDQDRYEESRDYYYKSLALKKKYNDLRGMASTYGNLADGYRQTGDYEKSIATTKIGMDLAKRTKSLDYLITAYKRLWMCYKATGKYDLALANHEQFKQLQDSLFNANKGRQINELMAQYAVAKKEKENADLKEAMTLSEYALSRQRVVIFGTAIGLVIVISLLYILYRYYSKSKSNELALSIEKIKVDGINKQLQGVLLENENMMNVMVHDLRSPLNKVSGLTELVRREGGLNQSQSSYLQMTGDVVSHGLRIIDDLFTITQKEARPGERLDVCQFLDQIKAQFTIEAGAKGIVLTLEKPALPVFVLTDRESLHRIIDNLVSNAIKFSPVGKEVVLSVENEKGLIALSVSDQGAGFSDEDRKSLYQKFKRLSTRPTAGEPSTGLGLAIVKQLTEHIGAEIVMESNVGRGTKFTVILPSDKTA